MSSTFVLQKMLKEISEVKWYQAEMHTPTKGRDSIWNGNYTVNAYDFKNYLNLK